MAKTMKIAGPKKGGPKLDSPQAFTFGKPKESSSHTSHSVEVDKKGVKHHRIHHTTTSTYEASGDKAPATMMSELLSKRDNKT